MPTDLEKALGLDKLPPKADRSKVALADGSPVTGGYRDLKANGQQKGYIVLSEEERRRGFLRPIRQSYKHVGPEGPRFQLRDLTEEEKVRYNGSGDEDVGACAGAGAGIGTEYVKYEEYPAGSRAKGRFWTQEELDRVGNPKCCGAVTTMSIALAETYARDPSFYSGTFCCGCCAHFPVGENGEFVWVGNGEKVGT
jgi:hypothetical protein